MPGPIFIRGDGITLHPIEDEDAPFLAETINDPAVREGLFGVEPLSEAEERDWIESIRDGDDVHLLICSDGDPVGAAGLNRVSHSWGAAELGYYVTPEAQGRGYATAAVDSLAGYAFDDLRLHRLTAQVIAGNEASRRVLEKNGFTQEGVEREAGFVDGSHVDLLRFGLLADEYRSG